MRREYALSMRKKSRVSRTVSIERGVSVRSHPECHTFAFYREVSQSANPSRVPHIQDVKDSCMYLLLWLRRVSKIVACICARGKKINPGV